MAGTLPESWIPPTHVLEVRALVRLYVDLLGEYIGWRQRLHATLFHHGAPAAAQLTAELLDRVELSPAGRDAAATALRQLQRLTAELDSLRRRLHRIAGRQPGCLALQSHYGIGPLTAIAIWEELGDTRRFSSSRAAVRHASLDVTVYSSDTTRAPGYLSRQGPAVLRWALFEAALRAGNDKSPDHAYYLQVKQRLGHATRHPVRRPQTRPPLPPHPAPSAIRRGRPHRWTDRRRADAHHLVSRGRS